MGDRENGTDVIPAIVGEPLEGIKDILAIDGPDVLAILRQETNAFPIMEVDILNLNPNCLGGVPKW